MHTKRSKHDKGEGVADDPFANATYDHQKTSEEEEYTFCTRLVQTLPYLYCVYAPVEAAPLPPAPLHPIKSAVRGVKLMRKPTSALEVFSKRCFSANGIIHRSSQRSWVTKRLAEVPRDSVLGREIQLLKEFWGHGDAASSTDAAKSFIRRLILGHVVGIAIIPREILLKRKRFVSCVHIRHRGYGT